MRSSVNMNTREATIPVANTHGKQASYSWFRGESVNFLPDRLKLCDPSQILDLMLKGLVPSSPLISRDTAITAFGSCFAANISNWLNARQYNVQTKQEGSAYIIRCGEGMVNTFTILGQFRWAYENHVPDGEFWHGYDAMSFGYKPRIQRETRRIFNKTDVFILTFGLSEIWYDRPTGEVFWRAVPADKFDPERHGFRLSTVEENKRNILEILKLIRRYRPSAKVVLTLSPIPLIATFRDMPCLVANSVSKATLRVAIDEALRETQTEAYYWPSYELVTEYFTPAWTKARRHVAKPVLDFIMTLFEAVYCADKPGEREFIERLVWARIADKTLPPIIQRSLKTGDFEAIRGHLPKLDGTIAETLKPALASLTGHEPPHASQNE